MGVAAEPLEAVHADALITSLERDIFPDPGEMPLEEIDRPLLLAGLRKIQNRATIEAAAG